jgi:hypothetical protein
VSASEAVATCGDVRVRAYVIPDIDPIIGVRVHVERAGLLVATFDHRQERGDAHAGTRLLWAAQAALSEIEGEESLLALSLKPVEMLEVLATCALWHAIVAHETPDGWGRADRAGASRAATEHDAQDAAEFYGQHRTEDP